MSELLLSAFNKFSSDQRADKINLTIGVLMDGNGRDLLLNTVNDVIIRIAHSRCSKAYATQIGDENFLTNVCEKILGIDISKIAFMSQTLGSSGALSIIARLTTFARFSGTVWIDTPGYVNYENIFGRTGITLKKYSFSRSSDFIWQTINSMEVKAGDFVVIQGGCHNPSGQNLTKEDWSFLLTHINRFGGIPIFDYAYIGFDEQQVGKLDAIEVAKSITPTFFVSFSASKSFTIYNERLGALYLCTDDRLLAASVRKFCIEYISNEYLVPPTSAAKIVNTIMESPTLQYSWKRELIEIRREISRVREQIKNNINTKYGHYINTHDSGIFALLPLSPLDVDKLRQDHGIHMLSNGRVNLSGLNNYNLERFCKAINSL